MKRVPNTSECEPNPSVLCANASKGVRRNSIWERTPGCVEDVIKITSVLITQCQAHSTKSTFTVSAQRRMSCNCRVVCCARSRIAARGAGNEFVAYERCCSEREMPSHYCQIDTRVKQQRSPRYQWRNVSYYYIAARLLGARATCLAAQQFSRRFCVMRKRVAVGSERVVVPTSRNLHVVV